MIKYIIWWINDEQTFEGTNGHVTVFFYNLSYFGRWLVPETKSTSSSLPICRQVALASAVMDCTILNTRISVRVHPRRAKSKSCSWCRGAQTPPKSKRRCCTLGENGLGNVCVATLFEFVFFLFSSFDALKKSLVGVQKYIQATDLSEASQEAVEEKLRATDRQ